MSQKTNAAIEKMTKECKNHGHLVPFEEYLTSICTTEAVADKILEEKKTLQGSFDAMKKVAMKRKVGDCAYIPPEEGFEIIRDYFKITDEDLKGARPRDGSVLDITDLL